MASSIGKIDASVGKCFVGHGDFVIFDAITIDASTQIHSFTNPLSLGDIKQGSVSWDGEAATVTAIKNTKGSTVCSYAENGTYAFSGSLLNMNKAVQLLFMAGVAITDASLNVSTNWVEVADIVGIGDTLASIERPIGWLNQDLNQMIFFPKAQIIAAYEKNDENVCIKINVMAESVSTAYLKTMMKLTSATVHYTA
jgi:hypothetical protein